MSVLCILQARMSSTRLPGKVLMPVLGEPMIGRQVERIRRARKLDGLVVATSLEDSDQALADYCRRAGIDCFRGSLTDVLGRFAAVAAQYRPTQVMRLTGDCPLTDPELLDRAVTQHLAEGNDYTSNVHERRFPDGLDVELFSAAVLTRAQAQAQSPFEREHVTPWMYKTGPELKRGVVLDPVDRSKERWVVDYPEDLDFVRRVFEALYPTRPDFCMQDILKLLADQPEIRSLNSMHA